MFHVEITNLIGLRSLSDVFVTIKTNSDATRAFSKSTVTTFNGYTVTDTLELTPLLEELAAHNEGNSEEEDV